MERFPKNPSTPTPDKDVPGPSYPPEHLERLYDAGRRGSVAKDIKRERASNRERYARDYRHAQFKKINLEIEQHKAQAESLQQPGVSPSIKNRTKNDPRFAKLFSQLADTTQDIEPYQKSLDRNRTSAYWPKRIIARLPAIFNQERKLLEHLEETVVLLIRDIDTAYEIVKEETFQNTIETLGHLEHEANELAIGLASQQEESRHNHRAQLQDEVERLEYKSEVTAQHLERGALRIRELAREHQAVVAHALPLSFWSINRTKGNNLEIDNTATDTETKINIVETLHPDLSASILSTEKSIQGLMYPLAVIVDGHIIASYTTDEGTKTKGKARVGQYGTLQDDPLASFGTASHTPTDYKKTQVDWNECVVHMPIIVGFLIDEAMLEERMTHFNTGNEEYLITDTDQKEEEDVRALLAEKHKDKQGLKIFVTYASDQIRGYGKKYVVAQWKQDSIALATQYVESNYPNYPLYFRRQDGIYDAEGNRMTAMDIYKGSGVSSPIEAE